jgi:hypothetical protein
LGDFWETNFLILLILKEKKITQFLISQFLFKKTLPGRPSSDFFFGGEFSPFFEKGIIVLKIPSVIFFKKIAKKVIKCFFKKNCNNN